MTKTRYNFTDGHNKDVKDKAPDWMNSLFENGFQKKEPTIIADLYSNSNRPVKKCSICGKILSSNEISKCFNCTKL